MQILFSTTRLFQNEGPIVLNHGIKYPRDFSNSDFEFYKKKLLRKWPSAAEEKSQPFFYRLVEIFHCSSFRVLGRLPRIIRVLGRLPRITKTSKEDSPGSDGLLSELFEHAAEEITMKFSKFEMKICRLCKKGDSLEC